MSLMCLILLDGLYKDDIKNRQGALDKIYEDEDEHANLTDSNSWQTVSEDEYYGDGLDQSLFNGDFISPVTSPSALTVKQL